MSLIVLHLCCRISEHTNPSKWFSIIHWHQQESIPQKGCLTDHHILSLAVFITFNNSNLMHWDILYMTVCAKNWSFKGTVHYLLRWGDFMVFFAEIEFVFAKKNVVTSPLRFVKPIMSTSRDSLYQLLCILSYVINVTAFCEKSTPVWVLPKTICTPSPNHKNPLLDNK